MIFSTRGNQSNIVHTCLQEVVQLHQYLETWLKGEIGGPESEPRRLADSLSDEFSVIHPSGIREDKAAVVSNFHKAWGSRSSDFSIRIDDMRHEFSSGTLHVLSYVETHVDVVPSVRRSTAILEVPAGGALKWWYLHETRLEQSDQRNPG